MSDGFCIYFQTLIMINIKNYGIKIILRVILHISILKILHRQFQRESYTHVLQGKAKTTYQKTDTLRYFHVSLHTYQFKPTLFLII